MGKEIRNYEFKTQNAQAFINDKGELKFKGKKGGKELKQLKPLFEAVLKADTHPTKNKKKLDSDTEKELMKKLYDLLMADGKVDVDELKLGDEFVNSGLTAKAFIDKKLAEANPVQEVKKEEVKEENEEVVITEDPVTEEIVEEIVAQNTPKQVVQTPEIEKKPDPRVSQNAFNLTIQNQRTKIQDKKDELTTTFTKEVTIDKGVYLYNVAVQALKDEGIEHPNAKQINERIAEIALVNDISDVNRVPRGKVIKVGKVGSPIPPVQAETPVAPTNAETPVEPATVTPSSINVEEKPVVDILTEQEYTAEDKTEGEGDNEFAYKEWKKEGSAPIYTTEVEGVTLSATSLDALKELKTKFAAATVTAAPEGEETDDAKGTRQATNLANLKQRIELSGGNIDVIEDVIDLLRGNGNVKLDSSEVQAFVQDLVKTKNVEVLTALLVSGEGEEAALTTDLIQNEETAKTVASLYKEIRDKENAGTKLTDDEVALKNFLADKVKDNGLYAIAADPEKGIAAKSLYFDEKSGNIAYKSDSNIQAQDPAVVDKVAKAIETANAAKADSAIENDTDAAAQARALAAVFKEYANTDDKILAAWLAANANMLHASKDDVLAFVAKNDLRAVTSLNYTPDADTDAEFNKAVADRVVALYEQEPKGDPANMRYINEALTKIDAATYDPEEDKQKAKDKVIESFFEVTGEGENKEYTFKPSRRPTYEEMETLLVYANADMQKAILASVESINDLGKGQYTQLLETESGGITTADLKAKYAELFEKAAAEFDLENKLDEAKAAVLKFIDAVGPNIDLIPFDKIQEKFGDVAFVKEHLGPQVNEDENVQRKLTVLDLDIKESEPDSEGKVTYSVDFSMAINFSSGSSSDDISLSAASKEELLEKAKPYIELQNIVYENKSGNANSTDVERENNLARLKEMFADENLEKDVKLAIVNFVIGLKDVYDEELIDAVIETKDPDFITAKFMSYDGENLTDTQAAKLIEYAKNPKLEDGSNNPFYLGTASGNDIREAIARRGKKEEITAIYDTLRPTDQLRVLAEHTEFFGDASAKLEQLINEALTSDKSSVAFYDILNLLMDKSLTLSADTANKLMAKIQRPLPVHNGREAIYSWADNFGNTVFYKKVTGTDGKITFKRCTAKDYAAEIKYEIDNNGTSHVKEKRQAEALSRLSSRGVADVVLAYSENGKGLIKDWNDEYAWFGDALGVDDMMPVIDKVLAYGSDSNKQTDEYKALVALVQSFKNENGKANTDSDFSSNVATQIDNAMIAYIKKVRGITE